MKGLVFLVLSVLIISSLQSQYDENLSRQLWRASSASYLDKSKLQGMNCGNACDELKGYQFKHQFTSQVAPGESVSYSVFVNPKDNKAIIAFRGTSSLTQLTKEAFQGRATSYNLHNVPNSVATHYFYSKYKNNLRDDMMKQVKEISKKNPNTNFYFTGHSLGGALTTHGALDVAMSKAVDKNKVHLYTYGAPRVGDYNFAKAVNSNIKTNYRVVNGRDIVPHLPPCTSDGKGGCKANPKHKNQNGHGLWSAYHAGTEVHYNNPKNSKSYKVCNKAEDPNCSKGHKLFNLRLGDHDKYLGLGTAIKPTPKKTSVRKIYLPTYKPLIPKKPSTTLKPHDPKKPTTPIRKPISPILKPLLPKKPTTPIKKPTLPIRKPVTPILKPLLPKKPTTPIKKPTIPIRKPVTPILKPILPKKPTTPALIRKPVTPQKPVVKPITPIRKPVNPTPKPIRPPVKPVTQPRPQPKTPTKPIPRPTIPKITIPKINIPKIKIPTPISRPRVTPKAPVTPPRRVVTSPKTTLRPVKK